MKNITTKDKEKIKENKVFFINENLSKLNDKKFTKIVNEELINFLHALDKTITIDNQEEMEKSFNEIADNLYIKLGFNQWSTEEEKQFQEKRKIDLLKLNNDQETNNN